MSVFTLNPLPSPVERFLGATAPNIQAGLSGMLDSYNNRQSARSLAQNIGLSGEEASSFEKMFAQIPAADQVGALQKFAEAQALKGYLGRQQAPESASTPPSSIGGTQFQPGELPPREEPLPAIGGLKDISKQQHEIMKENRAANQKYSEPYEDISKLNTIVNKLEQAKKIIESEEFDSSIFQRGLVAFLESGDEGALGELLKTPAQKKLFHLIRDSLRVKELGGSNPSTKELLIELASKPSYLTGVEASKFMIDNMIEDAKRNLKKSHIISGLRKYDPSMSPEVFKSLVEEKTLPVKRNEALVAIENEFPAAQYAGERISDETTGDVYESDGTKWVKVGG